MSPPLSLLVKLVLGLHDGLGAFDVDAAVVSLLGLVLSPLFTYLTR